MSKRERYMTEEEILRYLEEESDFEYISSEEEDGGDDEISRLEKELRYSGEELENVNLVVQGDDFDDGEPFQPLQTVDDTQTTTSSSPIACTSGIRTTQRVTRDVEDFSKPYTPTSTYSSSIASTSSTQGTSRVTRSQLTKDSSMPVKATSADPSTAGISTTENIPDIETLSEKKRQEVVFRKYGVTPKDKIKWLKNATFETPVAPFVEPLNTVTELKTPFQYFKEYFHDDLIQDIVTYTNMYVIHNNVKNFQPTTTKEIEIFIGILIAMGNIKMPRVRLYWDTKLGMDLIKDKMSVNRFFKLRQNIHVVDTTMRNPNDTDRFWKVRPLFDAIRDKISQFPLEREMCIDEQMVPFKGNLDVKQYVKGKPCPWGIKLFLLCGTSGQVYDFIIYQGARTELPLEYKSFGQGSAVIMTLSRRITERNHLLFFNNFFGSFQLFEWLTKNDIFASGTIRINRFGNPPLMPEKSAKKKSRGFSEEVVSKSGVVVTQWQDNKLVTLASNYVGKGNEDTCQRWNKKEARYIQIDRPEVVKLYNKNMGGVDKMDQLVTIYRTFIRSKKWTLRMFTHSIDLSITNSWLQYRKDADALQIPKKERLDLLHFRHEVAEALLNVGAPLSRRKRGRPSATPSPSDSRASSPGSGIFPPTFCLPSTSATTPTTSKSKSEVRPVGDVRYDQAGHWASMKSFQRCKMDGCKMRTSFVCGKCGVHLCITKDRNCFFNFHNH